MLLFLVKTAVTILLLKFIFCFYGNGISLGLFSQAFICTLFLCLTYWTDLVKLIKILVNYIRACRYMKTGKRGKAYPLFESLLSQDLAPAIPPMAEIKILGAEGVNQNAEASRSLSERAIKNGYTECYYTLAVVCFFGNSLEKNNDNCIKGHRYNNLVRIPRDYKECTYYLNEYFRTNKKNDKYYAEAEALLGYCLAAGAGITSDVDQSYKLFLDAANRGSKNLNYLKQCLSQQIEVTSYII